MPKEKFRIVDAKVHTLEDRTLAGNIISITIKAHTVLMNKQAQTKPAQITFN